MTLETVAMELPCGKCKRGVQIEITQPCIVNSGQTSVVSIVHDKTVECPHCRETLAIRLAAVQGYMFQTVPVQKPTTPLILHSGNGFRG